MTDDVIKLTQELIRKPSITPEDEGAISLVASWLRSLGFECNRLEFIDQKSGTSIKNLYARRGNSGPNFCFAGHTDVVPPGPGWVHNPFAAEIRDGILYGRGASDMKGGIAAFIAALQGFNQAKGSISLLITGDEEGRATHGTLKVLEWLAQRGEKLDYCLVGEPTNPDTIGQAIKIGRRGSLNGLVTIKGVQGHVAYPHLAKNPIPDMLQKLTALTYMKLDEGNAHFEPSNLEITTVDVGNLATNVIPGEIRAGFNIRFNDIHTSEILSAWLKGIFGDELEIEVSGEAFLTPPGFLSDKVSAAIEEVTGNKPELSTSGGTSDARFIKNYCPVLEFGLTNATIHKANENVRVEDLKILTQIYAGVLKRVLC